MNKDARFYEAGVHLIIIAIAMYVAFSLFLAIVIVLYCCRVL